MLKTALLEGILSLLVLAPLFFLAARSNKGRNRTATVFSCAALYLISNVLTQVLAIPVFEGQRFNWLGKGAATLFLIVCVALLPVLRKREELGLTAHARWEGARPILTVCAVYFLLRVGLYLFSGEASADLHLDTVLFQATLPGIHEELLYRGILLGLLSTVLVRPTWRLAQVDFGWPAVLTSLLFALDHGIGLSDSLDLRVNYFSLVRTAFDGFLFALLVHRTKSILPAVIYHNLLNLVGNH